MLDVDVIGSRCGPTCIDLQDRRGVIFEQRGRAELRVSKLQENRPKVLGDLGGMNGGKKFGSVELVDTVDCILDLYAKGPPQNIKTRPVIERRVTRSVACAAST